MENKGGEIEVRVGECSSRVSHHYQFINYVLWTAVKPHDDASGLGGAEIHAYGTHAGSVAKTQMGGLSADNLGQVSGPRRFFSARDLQ